MTVMTIIKLWEDNAGNLYVAEEGSESQAVPHYPVPGSVWADDAADYADGLWSIDETFDISATTPVASWTDGVVEIDSRACGIAASEYLQVAE